MIKSGQTGVSSPSDFVGQAGIPPTEQQWRELKAFQRRYEQRPARHCIDLRRTSILANREAQKLSKAIEKLKEKYGPSVPPLPRVEILYKRMLTLKCS